MNWPTHLHAEPCAARPVLACIGASTGGTEAIRAVLAAMPADVAPLLVVQHMPERFTASFAQRLDAVCRIRVKEAEHGERVLPGHAYVAPGHSHLMVAQAPGGYQIELSRTDAVNRHRPAVDVLFQAAATHVGARAVGVLLTGMGKDGAGGLLAMRQAGAWTIVQDEASSVVWGMPREAIRLGAASQVCALAEVSAALLARLRVAHMGARTELLKNGGKGS